MRFSPLLEQLIHALCCLPGVGPKTAQRMALQLLTHKREKGKQLAIILQEAMTRISHCQQCRILSESILCTICTTSHRNKALLCIVENSIDAIAIEQTASFKGIYFVLCGHLSPLDGMGPEEIGIPHLQKLFQRQTIHEAIIATNPTVEGEATAHYITELARPYSIKMTRIARGVSIGSELEYIDVNTLTHALLSREKIG